MLTRAFSHLPIAVLTGNAEKRAAVRTYIGNFSPPALLSCPAAFLCVCVCARVRARVCSMKSKGVFLKGITAHHSLLCSRVHSRNFAHHEIRQRGSFMTNNVVKDNGNKEAQSDMVMRLYFRAVAASVVVVVSCLVFLWDKRCLLETGGRFCQASKEVLWLQYSVSSASDHLSCMDPVNFPQWSCSLHLYGSSTAKVFAIQSEGNMFDNLGRLSHHRTNV